MLDSVSTKEIKFALSSESYVKLNKIIKEENQDTILASLSPNLIKKYLVQDSYILLACPPNDL